MLTILFLIVLGNETKKALPTFRMKTVVGSNAVKVRVTNIHDQSLWPVRRDTVGRPLLLCYRCTLGNGSPGVSEVSCYSYAGDGRNRGLSDRRRRMQQWRQRHAG